MKFLFFGLLLKALLSGTLFLGFDLPVDKECQKTSKHDDRAEDDKFFLLPCDYRTKDLASEFEFERKGNALRKIKSDLQTFVKQLPYCPDHSGDQDTDADDLDDQYAVLYKEIEMILQDLVKLYHIYFLTSSLKYIYQ